MYYAYDFETKRNLSHKQNVLFYGPPRTKRFITVKSEGDVSWWYPTVFGMISLRIFQSFDVNVLLLSFFMSFSQKFKNIKTN